ncbi:PE-PPE domain-containing protein [Corynebacterium lubricantis]|uniref:PE-PPE domain-containing protein n=1 Tax=Corynebacterium lubricantis TaxID=541095 RepID=UPI000378CA83|nr:PE-PPE domain-containing protein [Corynebacterium lubricantis]
MAKHTLFVVPGTWEVDHATGGPTKEGLLYPYTHRLNPDLFDVRFVNYSAAFGPIPPNQGLQTPDYAESRDAGIAELKKMINETPGTFGLVGFSQGGAVVDLVTRALVEGDMKHRLKDCLWVHAFASPHRAKGKTFHLDNPNRLKYEGIAGDPVTNTDTIDYFAYGLPDDVFTNCDIKNTYGVEIYNRAIKVSTQTPSEVIQSIATIQGILALLGASFGSSGSSSVGSSVEPIANPDFLTMLRTLTALSNHVTSEAHGRYNDPTQAVFNGRTAVEHSLNHLNYWGARI